jgi:hypothetical protein
LVADQHCLVAASLLASGIDAHVHTCCHDVIGLAPRRLERVPEVAPGARLLQDAIADTDPLPLEDVLGLDEVVVDADLETMRRCHRCRGLLRAFHRR